MFFSVFPIHCVILLLATINQAALGDVLGGSLEKRAPLRPQYNGKWVYLDGNRFIGTYRSDHWIPPESLAHICGRAAVSMKELVQDGARPLTFPMAMTVYQKQNGDVFFGSSGDNEHGEDMVERLAGGFDRGDIITWSFKNREFKKACGPHARNCEKKVHDGHVDDLYEVVKHVKITVTPAPSPEGSEPRSPSLKSPSPSRGSPSHKSPARKSKSPSTSPSPSRGSPPHGSHPRRSLDLMERDFNSITAREVQAALARGIQQRQVLEQRDVVLAQYEASLGRRDVYEAMFQPRDEYGVMRAHRHEAVLDSVY